MSNGAKTGFTWLGAIAVSITLLTIGAKFVKGEGASEEWREQAKQRLDETDARLDARFKTVEGRVEAIDSTMDGLRDEVSGISKDIEWLVRTQGGTPAKRSNP